MMFSGEINDCRAGACSRRGERFKFNAGGASRHATGEEWSPTVTLCVVRPLQTKILFFPLWVRIFFDFIRRGGRPRPPGNERFGSTKRRERVGFPEASLRDLGVPSLPPPYSRYCEERMGFPEMSECELLGFRACPSPYE